MRQLIRTPGGYWTAFFKGFFGTVGLFVTALTTLIFEVPKLAEIPRLVGIMVLISLPVAVVVGLTCVIPRLLYAWAYRRVTEP